MSSRRRARTWPNRRHRHFMAEMRTTAAAWFEAHQYPVHEKYPYILAHRDQWQQNVILPEVATYIHEEKETAVWQKRNFPLHKYIHHGLSSQALLFNLIGPLIVQKELSPLLECLLSPRTFEPTAARYAAQFEVEDRAVFNEDTAQPTSIDLVLRDSHDQHHFYIECKFTEAEFGGCSVFAGGDCDGRNPAQDFSLCYLHHIGRRYWELLEKHGFLGGVLTTERICPLSIHYQFFREVLFALEKGGTFVLLADGRNPSFFCEGESGQRGLFPFLMGFVPPVLHSRVRYLTIQQVVASIKKSEKQPWIREFEGKYGLEVGMPEAVPS